MQRIDDIKRELNSYPVLLGEMVRRERKRMKLSQGEFYEMLFPNSGKNPENIKKKMNAVENGKCEYVDYDLFQAICEKCELSADYLLQREKKYRNKEIELICAYTGLSQNAVSTLHSWKKAVDKDSSVNHGSTADLVAITADRIRRKDASRLLKIINLMFSNPASKKKKKKSRVHENWGIFYSLYLLTFNQPFAIAGQPLTERHPNACADEEIFHIDAKKFIYLLDKDDAMFPIDTKEIVEQIVRNQLNQQINELIDAAKEPNE